MLFDRKLKNSHRIRTAEVRTKKKEKRTRNREEDYNFARFFLFLIIFELTTSVYKEGRDDTRRRKTEDSDRKTGQLWNEG